MHHLHQDSKCLLLRHLQKKSSYQEALSLAVSYLAIVHRVGLADPEQSFLANTTSFLQQRGFSQYFLSFTNLEVVMCWKSTVNVPKYNFFIRCFLGDENPVVLNMNTSSTPQ